MQVNFVLYFALCLVCSLVSVHEIGVKLTLSLFVWVTVASRELLQLLQRFLCDPDPAEVTAESRPFKPKQRF